MKESDLPKLYRSCWVKLYWLTDTCEGGEHVQRDGYYFLKARRALRPDKSWFWQIDPWDAEECKYSLRFVEDLDQVDMFEGVVYKEPFHFDDRNIGISWNRSKIKLDNPIVHDEEKKPNWPF